MIKGVLEGCILIIISEKEVYGYEITTLLEENGFGIIAEGTIYPLLLRLERQKLICAEYKKSHLGPRRKYYNITPKGEESIEEFINDYSQLNIAVEKLITGKENEL